MVPYIIMAYNNMWVGCKRLVVKIARPRFRIM